MSDTLPSILVGTAGLGVAAVAAFGLAVSRARPALSAGPGTPSAQLLRLFAVGIALQAAHFSEEFATGFHLRFPALLGLAPWPASAFVAFNLAWLAIWLWALVALHGGFRASAPDAPSPTAARPAPLFAWFAVWFFAIAGALNGVAHPLLSLAVGGYFPGLVTSPLVGVAGALLWCRLLVATRPPL